MHGVMMLNYSFFSVCVLFLTMEKIIVNHLPLWQFTNLRQERNINHFVTTRRGIEGNDFTLSYSSTDDKEVVKKNRSALALAMGVMENRLYFPSQVHRTRIVEVDVHTRKDDLLETDALVTAHAGFCIAVMSADCVPVLLYDKANRVVAAVHSGWRGTVARIVEKTLYFMENRFGTKGENLIAGIGPSVSQESYEVGEEVIEEVQKSFSGQELMIHHRAGKAKLDLWKANQIQLQEFGVPSSQIETSDLCTVLNNDEFFSARKGDAGRFAAGIVLSL
jgi:polyphenol oxidase